MNQSFWERKKKEITNFDFDPKNWEKLFAIGLIYYCGFLMASVYAHLSGKTPNDFYAALPGDTWGITVFLIFACFMGYQGFWWTGGEDRNPGKLLENMKFWAKAFEIWFWFYLFFFVIL